jgi:hypothetical protein
MDENIVKRLNGEILGGLEFSLPGATEHARRESFYCAQLDVDFCRNCSLSNYGKDCHNNKVDYTTVWAVKSSR